MAVSESCSIKLLKLLLIFNFKQKTRSRIKPEELTNYYSKYNWI